MSRARAVGRHDRGAFWRHEHRAVRPNEEALVNGEGGSGRLEGKLAVITGAGRGIGYAYAERFLREGASVVVAELSEALGRDAAASLSKLGPVHVVATDVADEDSGVACAAATVERFG